jgi:hypothetical protein
MAKLGDDSRTMATAIIRAANKKADDTNIRLVTTGLASYARDGKPVARSSTARGDVSWYLETLAGIEKTTVETLLAPTGPAQPAAPSAAAEVPVKQAKTPKA